MYSFLNKKHFIISQIPSFSFSRDEAIIPLNENKRKEEQEQEAARQATIDAINAALAKNSESQTPTAETASARPQGALQTILDDQISSTTIDGSGHVSAFRLNSTFQIQNEGDDSTLLFNNNPSECNDRIIVEDEGLNEIEIEEEKV